MLLDISASVTAIFVLICVIVFFVFVQMLSAPLVASGRKRLALGVTLALIAWIIIQSGLSLSGFYLTSFDLPPRAMAILLPPILAMLVFFVFYSQGEFLQQLSLKTLTHIHLFRFPLEVFVLSTLALAGYIPDIMTYHGRNFDVIAGITAPLIAYLYFNKQALSWKVLLAWNIICVLLLFNVTLHAVLAMPYPDLQVFGLDQPNIGVFYFPYVWLPVILVQVAYFCHIASIIKLVKNRQDA